MNRFSMLAVVCLFFVYGCGGVEEMPECGSCVTTKQGISRCEADPDACQQSDPPPAPPPAPPQVAPNGTYGGYITISSWAGPDTRRCEQDTPAGFKIPLYITINGSQVRERTNPACEVLSTDPANFRFVCVNHNLPETCDSGSMYWDPVAGNCNAYYERREFALVFSRDAASVTGTVTDTRNWGGCSMRVWTVSFNQR